MHHLFIMLAATFFSFFSDISIPLTPTEPTDYTEVQRIERKTEIVTETGEKVPNPASLIVEYIDGFFVEDDGTIWVLDSYGHQAICYQGRETILVPLKETILPSDIIVDENYIYIYDDLLQALCIFQKDGTFLRSHELGLQEPNNIQNLKPACNGIILTTFTNQAYYYNKTFQGVRKLIYSPSAYSDETFDYISIYDTDNAKNKYWVCSKLLNDTSILAGELSILRTDKNNIPTGWYTIDTTTIVGIPDTFIQTTADGTTYLLVKTEDCYSVRKLDFQSSYYTYEDTLREMVNLLEQDYNNRAKQVSKLSVKASQTTIAKKASDILHYEFTLKPKNLIAKKNTELPKEYQYYLDQGVDTFTTTGIPYCWGGCNTLEESTSDYGTFTYCLKVNSMAGNTDTSGSLKSNTCGLDCSGYITALYGYSNKKNTTMLLGIGSPVTNLKEFPTMSLLVAPGNHVILYHDQNENFSIVTSEVAVREGKAIYKTRSLNQLMVLCDYQLRTPFPIKTTSVSVMMVGDNLIHNGINNQCKQEDGSYDASSLYEHVASVIATADLAIINQETIFVEKEKDYSGYPQFGSAMCIGEELVEVGFDIVAQATNHTLDKNISGVKQTLNFWKNYPEITVLGIHETEEDSDIRYRTENDITMAFVNYTYGLNGLDSRKKNTPYIVDMLQDKDIEETMKIAESTADITIAILHVGEEYVYTPSNSARKEVDRFIDLGADIVLCCHPHVVEGYGKRVTKNNNSAIVYYSLGNFISTQNKIPRVLGGMANLTITKDTTFSGIETYVSSYEMLPLITHQESGYTTTYLLSDYTDALCKKHKLFKNNPQTVSSLQKLYESYISEAEFLFSENK